MSQINTQDVVLLNASTVTTSGNGSDIVNIQGFQSAIVTVTTSTVTGTSPTLAVFIQKRIGQAAATDAAGGLCTGTAIYDDLISFTSITTATTRVAQVTTGPLTPTANATSATTADWANSDAALTAGSVRIGPLGGAWRVKYTVGGTSPSFGSVQVCVQLIPFST